MFSSGHVMPRQSFGLAIGILGAVTIVRLIGLHFSTVDLFCDESQYWAWSRELAFGHVTKPPLLAWVISAASHICGDSEACIRALLPLFWFGTSPEQILAWVHDRSPEDNFELTRPFTPAAAELILYVTACHNLLPLTDYFSNVEQLGPIVAPTGPATAQRFLAFKLSGPRGPIPPRGECDW